MKTRTTKSTRTLISIARHRNGVDGQCFIVATFDDSQFGRMVATWFPFLERETEKCIAVLNLEELAKGNIEFGENSWDGPHFLPDVRRWALAAGLVF